MTTRKLIVLAGICVLAAGCRFKGGESFSSATTPNPDPTWSGDRYASGGLADATGGQQPKTQYSWGAQDRSTQKTDPIYNRPAKGTGRMPGEVPGPIPGHGETNAPAFQDNPSTEAVPPR